MLTYRSAPVGVATAPFAPAAAVALALVTSIMPAAAQSTAEPPATTAPAASKAPDTKSGSEKGELAFNNNCRTCHTLTSGDSRLGPDLSGIIGRKAASARGFAYSESLKKSGLTWDEATLDKFIADPNALVPGNNMKPYNGISSAEDRKVIIEHLQSAAK